MTEPLLEVRGLSKCWPGFRLEDVDLALPGGMIMGLIGANGAGKTTLLRILMGLVRPRGGTLRFKGRDLLREGGDLRREIAYVPDEPRFFADRRLRDLKAACAPFYPAWDEALWGRLMADFGLDPACRAGQLSLGMRTRFALTLALARNAGLLVLDEPTTGLDPVFRRELLQRLSALIVDEGRSILFSTHITTDLEARADLVVLLQEGRVAFCETQDRLRETWGVVKGGLDLLEAAGTEGFQGLRSHAHGFEALVEDREAARRRFEGRALVERATLEDILVLKGRRRSHAA
jgi:ABC-2 type transport system ATP-binding protein